MLLVLSLGSLAFAQGVAGTDHDLSANDTGTRICVFCHFPHNAAPAVPLWNHTPSVADYAEYTSPTIDGVQTDLTGASANISAMCMSCHDGTIGLGNVVHQGSFGVITDPGAMGAVPARLGTDLTNDHPVGITYVDAAGTEMQPMAGVALPLFGAGANMVECASCHDVHNTPGIAPFLNMTDAASALCIECHDK